MREVQLSMSTSLKSPILNSKGVELNFQKCKSFAKVLSLQRHLIHTTRNLVLEKGIVKLPLQHSALLKQMQIMSVHLSLKHFAK